MSPFDFLSLGTSSKTSVWAGCDANGRELHKLWFLHYLVSTKNIAIISFMDSMCLRLTELPFFSWRMRFQPLPPVHAKSFIAIGEK
jgi:hypothetical protein